MVVGRGWVVFVYVRPMGALGLESLRCEGLRKAGGWKKSCRLDL